MNWTCAVCGALSRTNRRRCTKCGNMRWKPVPERHISELGGPMKRMAPRGLLLGKPGRQAPVQDSGGIECGTCHMVIYKVDGVFDAEAFQAARRKHYSVSPACEGHEHHTGKDVGSRPTG